MEGGGRSRGEDMGRTAGHTRGGEWCMRRRDSELAVVTSMLATAASSRASAAIRAGGCKMPDERRPAEAPQRVRVVASVAGIAALGFMVGGTCVAFSAAAAAAAYVDGLRAEASTMTPVSPSGLCERSSVRKCCEAGSAATSGSIAGV
eukprot:scaffold45360_cov26-Tisochrysis_lutea.AAC.2